MSKKFHHVVAQMRFPRQLCSFAPTSVCWMACEAALAILWLSLASSTFSLMSGRSCFSSSSSVFSSLASPAPSAVLMASCNMASRQTYDSGLVKGLTCWYEKETSNLAEGPLFSCNTTVTIHARLLILAVHKVSPRRVSMTFMELL